MEVEDTRLAVCEEPGYLAHSQEVRANYVWHRFGYSDVLVDRTLLAPYLEALKNSAGPDDVTALEPYTFTMLGKITTESCFLQPDGNWNTTRVQPFKETILAFALRAPDSPFNAASDDYHLALQNIRLFVRDSEKSPASSDEHQGLKFADVTFPHIRLRHVLFEVRRTHRSLLSVTDRFHDVQPIPTDGDDVLEDG